MSCVITFDAVAPLPGQLAGRLAAFDSGVHAQDFVISEKFGHLFFVFTWRGVNPGKGMNMTSTVRVQPYNREGTTMRPNVIFVIFKY